MSERAYFIEKIEAELDKPANERNQDKLSFWHSELDKIAKVAAFPAAPHLVDLLKARLSEMATSPPIVELSPLGGMQGQADKPFGKKMYGISQVATAVAKLADNTYANFSEKKVQPNKVHYVMGALLSGMGTGKSAFLDRHVSVLREYCQNPALKDLLRPECHPLILNVTFNSGTDYSAKEGADSGAVSIARRLVYAYTNAPWDLIMGARTEGIVGLQAVLKLLEEHHRKVCNMADNSKIVVVINVDEVNQIHSHLNKTAADGRVREVVGALRQLSMAGVTGAAGVGPVVLCLLAGTGNVAFRRALDGSGIEYVTPSMPLLNGAEVLDLMKQCGVHDNYLSDRSFLQLLEDTAGVPRLLRKILEGLTLQFAESSIAVARSNALQYVEGSHMSLSSEERAALIPYIVLGVAAPPMPSALVTQSPTSRTFEDLRMSGAIFQDGGRLVMPVLLLEALFPMVGPGNTTLIGRLVYWYRERSWEGFEMFCALFHATKMQYLSKQSAREISMGDFYWGALMPPRVAALKIRLKKGTAYEVEGGPTDNNTYQFPGRDKDRNKAYVGLLNEGAILLNGKRAPAGDCLLANPLVGVERGVLVRSLCVAHTTSALTLTLNKIGNDNSKAREAFQRHPHLFGEAGATELVTVHLSNRELHRDARIPQNGCIVIGRDQMLPFFGPTFQRGLVSPIYATTLSSANSPRAYCTASRADGRRLMRPPQSPPMRAPALPSCSVTGLRLVRNLTRCL